MSLILDEYKDPQKARRILDAIHSIVGDKKIKLMEVCGTHTQAIFRYGIRGLLPNGIEIVSGPGCPVCVTPNSFIDTLIALSEIESCIIVVFGDLLKVPGSRSTLLKEKSKGKDVRIVYSPLDALEIAIKEKQKMVVFSGIGFETTAPSIAVTILEAEKKDVKNFFVLSAIKLLPPALKSLISSKELPLNGLILPGHVSAIIGLDEYRFLAEEYSIAGVVAGFEPLDILMAIYSLSRMITTHSPSLENKYTRVVKPKGNEKARKILGEVFEECDSEWRGLGLIRRSGLALRREFSHRNPLNVISVGVESSKENPDCICGSILRGVKKPTACLLFGKTCTPENPIGACMVSNEGSCAAYFKYS